MFYQLRLKKKKHELPNMYHTQFIFSVGLPKYQYDEIQLVKLCNCNDSKYTCISFSSIRFTNMARWGPVQG